MNRGDLMEHFGLARDQSSVTLNRCISFAPEYIAYDRSTRTYVLGLQFKPHFLKPDASRHLAQLPVSHKISIVLLDREVIHEGHG